MFKESVFRFHQMTTGYFLDTYFSKIFRAKARNIKTIACLMGPYRNLTTLSASFFSLHPQCQVLNHAGQRVFNNNHINPFSGQNIIDFEAFAIYASIYGRRGGYGGSILKSHAFENPILKKKYFSRFKGPLKKDITCICWKESLLLSNFLKKNRDNLKDVLNKDRNGIFRFILPVRNPIHCALSNLKTRHNRYFENIAEDYRTCINSVLDEYKFFLELKNKFPDKFMYFFEYEIDNELFKKISVFLNIFPDRLWIEDCVHISVNKGKYHVRKDEIEFATDKIMDKFSNQKEFRDRLLLFFKN